MSKILYVGNEVEHIRSGADSVNKRNLDILSSSFDSKNIIIKELVNSNSFFDKLTFYIGGLTSKIEADVLDLIRSDSEIQFVFLSQSLLGRLSKKIKNEFKDRIKVITFFHNIEKHYAKEFIKTDGFMHYPFYWWASFNERNAAKYSDVKIVLNERDNLKLRENYQLSADVILPATYADKFDFNESVKAEIAFEYLFVGTAFFANIEAVRWFVKYVLPFVPGKLAIVGKEMDLYKKEFESDRVYVSGFVDDLSKYYYQTKVVIAPILSGGGMKTKIAEALMYGKLILGSQEAFEGYIENRNAMILCNSAEDYIKCLNSEEVKNSNLINQDSRECFLNNYSNRVIANDLKYIFDGK